MRWTYTVALSGGGSKRKMNGEEILMGGKFQIHTDPMGNPRYMGFVHDGDFWVTGLGWLARWHLVDTPDAFQHLVDTPHKAWRFDASGFVYDWAGRESAIKKTVVPDDAKEAAISPIGMVLIELGMTNSFDDEELELEQFIKVNAFIRVGGIFKPFDGRLLEVLLPYRLMTTEEPESPLYACEGEDTHAVLMPLRLKNGIGDKMLPILRQASDSLEWPQ